MSQSKTERLLNLTWTLRATRQLLTKEQLRDTIEGYGDRSGEAFDRMFERDKEELRELGVPIESVEKDPGFSDEIGYRISTDTAELPLLDLTAEEAAVIGLAAHVWEHAGLAGQSGQAIAKLRAIGVEVDTDVAGGAEPRLPADEPAFDPIWDAVHNRTPVRFTYQRPGHDAAVRTLEPWRIVNWRGRWYVGGYDRDRRAARLFRLGRISGAVELLAREAGSFDVPADTDWDSVARDLFGAPATEAAVLRVKANRGHWLRRRAEAITTLDASTDELHVSYGSLEDLASEVASYGDGVVAVSPRELRTAVIRRLRAAAEQNR